jgi:ribonuclease HII
MSRTPAPLPTFEREQAAHRQGYAPVAGCDEVGRGPWAGPVVTAAVILDPARVPAGLNDSKKLTASRRETLFAAILATADVALATTSPGQIDRTDIRRATLDALARAVAALPVRPQLVLVDGRDRLAGPWRCEAVIGGDGRIASIAAASIVAKVIRDRMMCRLDAGFPAYGFARHKGYGTAEHAVALAAQGPCPAHRQSFAPVAAALPRAPDG